MGCYNAGGVGTLVGVVSGCFGGWVWVGGWVWCGFVLITWGSWLLVGLV